MSILNTSSPPMVDSNGKVATWIGSGTSARTQTISFTVDSEPTKWILVCIGAPTEPCETTTNSYYMIAGAYQNGGNILSSEVRYYSSGSRIYGRSNYVSKTYSNNMFTLSSANSYFYNKSSSEFVTYILCYS